MANYTNELIAQSFYDSALQATGLEDLSMEPLTFLNMVGQFMVGMHSWRWLTKQQARLKARGNISITDGTWDESELTLTSTGAWTDYTWVPGDLLEVTGGTSTINKYIEVTARTDANVIVLAESLASTGADLATGDIAATLHTPTMTLPDDFGSLSDGSANNTLVNGLALVTPTELQRLRTNQIEVSSSWAYRGAIINVGTPPRPVLDVYPDFSSDTEDQFSIVYKRGWTRLTEMEDVVDIPGYMLALYLELVRGYALGLEDTDEIPLQQQLTLVEQGPTFRMAKNMDWREQKHFGRMTGGQVAKTSPHLGPNALSTEVAGPS